MASVDLKKEAGDNAVARFDASGASTGPANGVRGTEAVRFCARRRIHAPSTASRAGGPGGDAGLVLAAAGCTSPMEYVRNGFKVGPNYQPAPPPWPRIGSTPPTPSPRRPPDLARWWTVFNDPALNRLVDCAYRQNLSLRQAGFRVLEARLQLAIARGELFPQTQTASGGYERVARAPGISGVPTDSSTSGITVSTWPGSWTSGAGCGG